jgi:tetratricopeptide (TPR) repeat protein
VLAGSERIGQAFAGVDRERSAWPVVDAGGLLGVVTREQLEAAVQEGSGELTTADLVAQSGLAEAEPPPPWVHVDEPLESAMRLLADGRLKALAVVSRGNLREVKGAIALADVLAAYSIADSRPDPADTDNTRSRGFRLLATVAVVLFGVAIFGAFLTYYYRAERDRRAERSYQEGTELLRRDRLSDAIEQYRYALSISHRLDHRMALALALVKAERMNEAATYLNEILRERPNSGPANLAMAETLAAQDARDGAVVHYRRAILGSWTEKPEESRYRARKELIEFLAKTGERTQARAEVLALAADAPKDPSLEIEVGRMLTEHGLLREATDLFRKIVRTGSPNAAVYDGLGEALFLSGRYSDVGAFQN